MRALLILLFVVGCKDKAPPKPAPTPPVVVDAAVAPRTSTVRADRRVDLISIICRLANYDEYTRAKGTPYLDAVDSAFAPFAQHPAVAMARELRAKHGISFDAPMVFAVHLDDALVLQNGAELPTIDARWTGVDAAAFAEVVKAFAAEAKLDEFLAQHAAYRDGLVKTLEGVIAKENPVAWFDGVFGPAQASFVVVPSPIAGTMNFGPRATVGGALQMVQILGVSGKGGEIEVDEQLVGLLVHEMAHSYINPVFTKHRGELVPAGEKIFALVEKQMRAQAYADVLTMLNESGVRAVVVNYMRDKHGDLAGARAARQELRRGFVWMVELTEVFRQLAKSGTRDLDGHMPKIVAFFEQLAERYANGLPPQPFQGPVDAVHQRDPVWVVPSSGPEAGYARMIHAQLKKTGAIVVASDATLREQRGHDLVAYGTAADNAVVDFIVHAARWTIGKDHIELGNRTFVGPGLVLIACWHIRDDPSRGAAIYTAFDRASLVGINSVRHGPNDWLVARKQGAAFVILGTGDFPRGVDDAWLLPGDDGPVPVPPLRK